MSEKRKTIEDAHGFRLVWSVSDTWADVTAYEMTGTFMDGSPCFELESGNGCDATENIDEAEVYLSGFVKWDGCTELDQGQPHWCGPNGYKKHIALLRHIYIRAHELMGRQPEEPWGDSPAVIPLPNP